MTSVVRTVTAMRYITPLREGGSLPAVVEADDEQLYVMKFAGAGQGRKALIAELVAGEICRALGLPVPELVFVILDPALGPSEPNAEISDLLRASVGLNLGMRYLPHSLAYHPLGQPQPDPLLASHIVWFDAYVTNVDRTPRNTNILVHQRELWLIDHGASLYFHHDWRDYLERARSPFPYIREHVLLPRAAELAAADRFARGTLSPELLRAIVALIPEDWLVDAPFATRAEHRDAYVTYLERRLAASPAFVGEANHARSMLL